MPVEPSGRRMSSSRTVIQALRYTSWVLSDSTVLILPRLRRGGSAPRDRCLALAGFSPPHPARVGGRVGWRRAKSGNRAKHRRGRAGFRVGEKGPASVTASGRSDPGGVRGGPPTTLG